MRILFHLFVVSFVFSFLFACSSEGGENDKISEIELEKQKVELEREKLRLEKEKQELENKNESNKEKKNK
jgi:cell division protein FtsB